MDKIEILDFKDFQKFYALFVELLENDFPTYSTSQIDYFKDHLYSKSNFERLIEDKSHLVVVWKENEEIRGFLVGDYTFAGVGFITWFGVDKNFRDKGIGRNLVDFYCQKVKSLRGHLVEGYTFSKVVGFYKKLGFEVVGKRRKGYFGIENIIVNRYV